MNYTYLFYYILLVISYRFIDGAHTKKSECSSELEACRNFSSAVECHAVKHCILTEWSILKPDEKTKCGLCVDQITDIKNSINHDLKKEDIQNSLFYVCAVNFIIHFYRQQCEVMIHDYLNSHMNNFLDLLSSNVAPENICTVVGLCSSQSSVSSIDFLDSGKDENGAHVETDNVVLYFSPENFNFGEMPIFKPAIVELTIDKERTVPGKCTWGPSYWCSNLTSSHECSSTRHCIDLVWPKREFVNDVSSVCQICKNMVKQTRNQLFSNNKFKNKLKQVFESSCRRISTDEVKLHCMNVSNQFLPELIEILNSKMNSIAICSVIGLCNSPKINKLLLEFKDTMTEDNPQFSNYDSCLNCTTTFMLVRHYVEHASKDEVLFKMLIFCEELSSFSEVCSNMIRKNWDIIYMSLKTVPDIGCYLSAMCVKKHHFHIERLEHDFQNEAAVMVAAIKATGTDDLSCNFCKQLLVHLQNILIINTTEKEFYLMMQSFCDQTNKYRNDCLTVVSSYHEIIYNYLTTEIDPQNICRALQICPRPNNYLIGKDISEFKQSLPLVFLPTGVMVSTTNIPKEVSNIKCRLCRLVVSEIEKELQNPNYDNDVVKVLGNVCNLVPAKDHQPCVNFIRTYSDTLIKLFITKTDPNMVCAVMQICKE